MKTIVLDSGPVISLALNNLLWLFTQVKEKYNIRFIITEAVKKEIVDHPFETKKFKFEAIQVMVLLDNNTIEVVKTPSIIKKTEEFISLANRSFRTDYHELTLVHFAEFSAICASLELNADAVMIDERTTRYMMEKPDKLKNLLMHKLHTKIRIQKKPLETLRRLCKNVKFIRSAEFVSIAFEKGMLDKYLPKVNEPKKNLLGSLLWALKLNGCAISNRDLETIMRLEEKYIK